MSKQEPNPLSDPVIQVLEDKWVAWALLIGGSVIELVGIALLFFVDWRLVVAALAVLYGRRFSDRGLAIKQEVDNQFKYTGRRDG